MHAKHVSECFFISLKWFLLFLNRKPPLHPLLKTTTFQSVPVCHAIIHLLKISSIYSLCKHSLCLLYQDSYWSKFFSFSTLRYFEIRFLWFKSSVQINVLCKQCWHRTLEDNITYVIEYQVEKQRKSKTKRQNGFLYFKRRMWQKGGMIAFEITNHLMNILYKKLENRKRSIIEVINILNIYYLNVLIQNSCNQNYQKCQYLKFLKNNTENN